MERKYLYLGEFDVDLENTPFSNYQPNDWVMDFVEKYSQIDGAHHKQWVLDQVARILKGTHVIVTVAKWDDGSQEYRIRLAPPSEQYLQWVDDMLGSTDEQNNREYSYDEGIAP